MGRVRMEARKDSGFSDHRIILLPTAAADDEEQEHTGGLSNQVKDSPNKICVSQIPIYLSEEQVVELLSTLGQAQRIRSSQRHWHGTI